MSFAAKGGKKSIHKIKDKHTSHTFLQKKLSPKPTLAPLNLAFHLSVAISVNRTAENFKADSAMSGNKIQNSIVSCNTKITPINPSTMGGIIYVL